MFNCDPLGSAWELRAPTQRAPQRVAAKLASASFLTARRFTAWETPRASSGVESRLPIRREQGVARAVKRRNVA